jgi:hypothetical protein
MQALLLFGFTTAVVVAGRVAALQQPPPDDGTTSGGSSKGKGQQRQRAGMASASAASPTIQRQPRAQQKPRRGAKVHVYVETTAAGAGSNWDQHPDTAQAWNDLGRPWPHWQPCDAALVYTKACAPVEPSCSIDARCEAGKALGGGAGLGSELKTHIGVDAENAFGDGCTYNYSSIPTVRCPFDLSAHCVIPPRRIPSQQNPGCALFAITQPRKHIKDHLASVRPGPGKLPQKPLVGLHVRTGWADVLRKVPKLQELDCSAFEGDDAYTGATAEMVGYELPVQGKRKWHTFEMLLENTVRAGDGAFGANNWVLFLATDSPAALNFVHTRLSGRVLQIVHEGALPGGHSNVPQRSPPSRSPGGAPDTSAQLADLKHSADAMSDFISLSQCDMLIYLTSTYSATAYARTDFCPKRRLELNNTMIHRSTHRRVLHMTELFNRCAKLTIYYTHTAKAKRLL